MDAQQANPPATGSRPLRVCLFTDTLGDVNGVSRFISNIATQALRRGGRGGGGGGGGDELHAITSTRFVCPDQRNVHNLKPRFSRPMPGYSTLDVVWPDRGALFRLADRLAPDVVHVSTPGPVGAVGRSYALKRGLPIVGTYHTDFPAYVEHLFDDPVLTWITRASMTRFYTPFHRIFSRSDDYALAMEKLGVPRDRIERLLPGIDTDTFSTRFANAPASFWEASPRVRPESVKLLYVGRVSVEKNLPWLTKLWPMVRTECVRRGLDAQLLIVGDGPYRVPMQQALVGTDAQFLGFKHGVELSTIYANSHVFVFPSTTDTLGQVVMESQAAGLPVVVTDQGGPSEVVDRGVTGFVLPVAPADKAMREWSDVIVRLIADGDLRQRMGAAGAAKIAPMSIRHSYEHFWNVHQRVASTHAR